MPFDLDQDGYPIPPPLPTFGLIEASYEVEFTELRNLDGDVIIRIPTGHIRIESEHTYRDDPPLR